MLGHIVFSVILSLILLGYIPAMIAAGKDRPFLRWYFFGVALFPVAMYSVIKLKSPVKIVNVLSTKEDGGRRKKAYKKAPAKKYERHFSPKYVVLVFLTKFIAGVFSGIIAFALARMFLPNTEALRIICIAFSLLHSVLLAITELCNLSRIPVMADEVTKRTLQMLAISVVASLPMFFLKNIITGNVTVYREFIRFLCTLTSFVIFLVLLFRLQRSYYGKFAKFFDYCMISIGAYTVYSAVTLSLLSFLKGLRWCVYVGAMQLQLFNFTYFSEINNIVNPASLYAVAVEHLVVAVLLLVSGLQCRAFKRTELANRAEYRTKAFRMSKKRVLRRHIPRNGMI